MSAQKASKYVPASSDASAVASATSGVDAAATPWIESADPKRRQIGQAVLILLWIYVAALCLLALDQWLNWGLFGPKIAPLP